MQVGTIVLCDGTSLRMAAALEAAGFDVHGVSHAGGPWVAECSVSLMRSVVQEPIVLVASGARCDELPAVGWARRSARRPVGAYVLIDPTTTPVHRGQGDGDWPDAPVIVLTGDQTEGHSDAARADERAAMLQARLRGWTVVPYENRPDDRMVEVLNS
jgi:hypothetical protein